MLTKCPTCAGQNTPGALRCHRCGYRLIPRDTPFVVPENTFGLRVEFLDAPPSYRATPKPRLRITRRSELLGYQFVPAIVIGAGLGATVFYAPQHGQPQGAVGATIVLALLAYWLTARVANRITIELDAHALRVRQTPIPTPGTLELRANDIVEVYCDARNDRRQFVHDFRVHVRLRNGERRMIVSGIPTGDEAQLIEDLIETQLGITDAREASTRHASPRRTR